MVVAVRVCPKAKKEKKGVRRQKRKQQNISHTRKHINFMWKNSFADFCEFHFYLHVLTKRNVMKQKFHYFSLTETVIILPSCMTINHSSSNTFIICRVIINFKDTEE